MKREKLGISYCFEKKPETQNSIYQKTTSIVVYSKSIDINIEFKKQDESKNTGIIYWLGAY